MRDKKETIKSGLSCHRLIAVPEFGLCNRLRVIGHLSGYSRLTRREFKVLWQPSDHCCAEFTDLFQPEPFLITEIDSTDFKLYDCVPFGIELAPHWRGVNFLSTASTMVIRTGWLPNQKFLPNKVNFHLRTKLWPEACEFISKLQPKALD